MRKHSSLRSNTKKMCQQISGSSNQHFIDLGKSLQKIKDEKIYESWNYKSFQFYIDHELTISRRKVSYLIHLYKRFFLDCNNVEKRLVQAVGWSKASRIAECKQIRKNSLNKTLNMAMSMSLREVDEYLITVRPNSDSRAIGKDVYRFRPKKSDRERIETVLKAIKKKYGVRQDRLLIKLIELVEDKV